MGEYPLGKKAENKKERKKEENCIKNGVKKALKLYRYGLKTRPTRRIFLPRLGKNESQSGGEGGMIEMHNIYPWNYD